MAFFQYFLLGLIALSFASCGGKKSNEDNSISNRTIISEETNLTPNIELKYSSVAHSLSQNFNYQRIDIGTMLRGKEYVKVLKYIANQNGFFYLQENPMISAFCTTDNENNFSEILAEYKIKVAGSNTFETVSPVEKMIMREGFYLKSGDELKIYLTLKSLEDCGKIKLSIMSIFTYN